MKKTIAILLVLVIGMVGVFADTSADLRLKTTVDPIDVMAIVAKTTTLSASDFTNSETLYPDGTYTSFTTEPNVAVTLTDDTSANQEVGKLYTYSNRRIYRVEIKATPLSSVVTGGTTAYMHYKVSAGSGGTTNTYETNATGEGALDPVIFYSANFTTATGAQIGASGVSINVLMLTAKSSVPSGEYTGAITFNYIAN